MMPKVDGWQVCRDKKVFGCSIIMLTARSDEKDELLGFELVWMNIFPNHLVQRYWWQELRLCLKTAGIDDG